MIAKPDRAFWERIHNPETTYLLVSECWKTCNDGFCCNNRNEYVKFKAIPTGQQSFPMLVEEFEYLKSIKALAPEMETEYREMSIELENGKRAGAYMVTCKQGGRCYNVERRPFICKIYPFIPIPDVKGKIEGYEIGSVFDLMFHHRKLPSPCTILEENSSFVKDNLHEKIKFIFEKPYFIFYFYAFHLMADLLREGLQKNFPEPESLSVKDFFLKFELSYLGGKLASKEDVSRVLNRLYKKLEDEYGEFEI